jgi:hypothetical protein
VTVGSPLAGEFTSTEETVQTVTIANTALGEAGAHVTSPVTGRIVRWRTKGGFGAFKGMFRLRVLRPTTGGEFIGAGTSAPQTLSGSPVTFPANMPIQAGDLIGLDDTSKSDVIAFGGPFLGSSGTLWRPQVGEGSISGPGEPEGPSVEYGFNADVQPAPGLIIISPTLGPVSGGTAVTIAGHNFEGVTGVNFGSSPASNFTVGSENAVSAVSPSTAQPGVVDVTVTAAGGTSATTPGDQFTYTAGPGHCVVPKLIGKTLKASRRKLRKANCRLGKVKGKKSKTAKVITQRPKPRKVLPAGSKVKVKLSG